MTSYGNTIKTETLVGKDVYVDTVHWKTFDPPLSGGGAVPTLAAVLDTSSDANEESITNLNALATVSVTATGDVSANNLTATTKASANQFEGSGVNPSITGINTVSTNNLTVVNQLNATTSTITCNNLNATASIGAPLGTITTITATNVNTQNLQNPGGTVKVTGLQARSEINLEDDAVPPVRHNITNVNTITATALSATAIEALQASITSLGSPAVSITGSEAPNSGILNLNASTGGTVKLDFTGVSGTVGQDTEIEGDDTLNNAGQPKMTKCTYLDLTDPSNRVPEPTEESYRWGVYFAPTTQIRSDFDNDTARVFNENCYFTYFSNNADHSNMIFELNFFIEEYGYGDIQLQIYYQPSDQSQTRRPLPNSELFYVPEESATAFRSVRKVGQCHASWLVNNMPTDGKGYNFWIAARTNFSDNGRMIISMRQNGGNPDTASERGAPVTFQCYPKPTRWRLAP